MHTNDVIQRLKFERKGTNPLKCININDKSLHTAKFIQKKGPTPLKYKTSLQRGVVFKYIQMKKTKNTKKRA